LLPIIVPEHTMAETPLNFEEKWTELQGGCLRIVNDLETTGITAKEWMKLFHVVYQVCTNVEEELKQKLYDKIGKFFEEAAHAQAKDLKTHRDDEFLLSAYLKKFTNYTTSTNLIFKIFSYMHRYWIPSQASNGVRDVFTLSLIKWRDIVFVGLKERLLGTLLNIIDKDRVGEQIDRTMISNMVQSYLRLGVDEQQPVVYYQKEFQVKFIERTNEFYAKESADFLVANGVSQYMRKASARLEQEQTRSRQYLHPSTEAVVIKACEQTLIKSHMEVLQGEFQAMLSQDREDDMTYFYGLLSRLDDGLLHSSQTMRTYLKDKGEALVQQQASNLETRSALKNSVPLVQSILSMYKHYKGTIKKCFSNHKLFIQALDEAFTVFVNKDVGVFKMAELLSFYADHVLKGGEKVSEEELEEKLDLTVQIFGYLDDKDIFYEAFRRALSKRLLSREVNDDAEKFVIGKLKVRCGDVFTSKLEGMFNDMTISAETASRFKNWLEDNSHSLKIDLQVQVLNSVYWPLNRGGDLVLASELTPCVDLFEKFYQATTQKRRLQWLYNQGTVTLDANCGTKKVILVASTIQACILLLFNNQAKLTFKEIQTSLNLIEDVLKMCIHPLVWGKIPLLKRSPEDQKDVIDANDQYTFEPKLGPKAPRRIVLPPGSSKMVRVEAEEGREKVNLTRVHQIEAALVRTMKARQTLSQAELFAASAQQLAHFFKLDPREMKKRVESLIERGFFKRDEKDNRIFHYIA
jgi:cullin 1